MLSYQSIDRLEVRGAKVCKLHPRQKSEGVCGQRGEECAWKAKKESNASNGKIENTLYSELYWRKHLTTPPIVDHGVLTIHSPHW